MRDFGGCFVFAYARARQGPEENGDSGTGHSRGAARPWGPADPARPCRADAQSAGILSGKYRPGDRLNESQIARELNISRIPVREALSQLQEQGLVQNRERRGMFVTNIGADEVQQITSLRIILETEALRLARTRMTPGNPGGAGSRWWSRWKTGTAPCWRRAALDLEFHRILWRAAGNPYLERSLNALMMPLFAHKTLEHVTQDVRRWRMSHHRRCWMRSRAAPTTIRRPCC